MHNCLWGLERLDARAGDGKVVEMPHSVDRVNISNSLVYLRINTRIPEDELSEVVSCDVVHFIRRHAGSTPSEVFGHRIPSEVPGHWT
jgi:hypothetical protein